MSAFTLALGPSPSRAPSPSPFRSRVRTRSAPSTPKSARKRLRSLLLCAHPAHFHFGGAPEETELVAAFPADASARRSALLREQEGVRFDAPPMPPMPARPPRPEECLPRPEESQKGKAGKEGKTKRFTRRKSSQGRSVRIVDEAFAALDADGDADSLPSSAATLPTSTSSLSNSASLGHVPFPSSSSRSIPSFPSGFRLPESSTPLSSRSRSLRFNAEDLPDIPSLETLASAGWTESAVSGSASASASLEEEGKASEATCVSTSAYSVLSLPSAAVDTETSSPARRRHRNLKRAGGYFDGATRRAAGPGETLGLLPYSAGCSGGGEDEHGGNDLLRSLGQAAERHPELRHGPDSDSYALALRSSSMLFAEVKPQQQPILLVAITSDGCGKVDAAPHAAPQQPAFLPVPRAAHPTSRRKYTLTAPSPPARGSSRSLSAALPSASSSSSTARSQEQRLSVLSTFSAHSAHSAITSSTCHSAYSAYSGASGCSGVSGMDEVLMRFPSLVPLEQLEAGRLEELLRCKESSETLVASAPAPASASATAAQATPRTPGTPSMPGMQDEAQMYELDAVSYAEEEEDDNSAYSTTSSRPGSQLLSASPRFEASAEASAADASNEESKTPQLPFLFSLSSLSGISGLSGSGITSITLPSTLSAVTAPSTSASAKDAKRPLLLSRSASREASLAALCGSSSAVVVRRTPSASASASASPALQPRAQAGEQRLTADFDFACVGQRGSGRSPAPTSLSTPASTPGRMRHPSLGLGASSAQGGGVAGAGAGHGRSLAPLPCTSFPLPSTPTPPTPQTQAQRAASSAQMQHSEWTPQPHLGQRGAARRSSRPATQPPSQPPSQGRTRTSSRPTTPLGAGQERKTPLPLSPPPSMPLPALPSAGARSHLKAQRPSTSGAQPAYEILAASRMHTSSASASAAAAVHRPSSSLSLRARHSRCRSSSSSSPPLAPAAGVGSARLVRADGLGPLSPSARARLYDATTPPSSSYSRAAWSTAAAAAGPAPMLMGTLDSAVVQGAERFAFEGASGEAGVAF